MRIGVTPIGRPFSSGGRHMIRWDRYKIQRESRRSKGDGFLPRMNTDKHGYRNDNGGKDVTASDIEIEHALLLPFTFVQSVFIRGKKAVDVLRVCKRKASGIYPRGFS
jgi:hypothetical protein